MLYAQPFMRTCQTDSAQRLETICSHQYQRKHSFINHSVCCTKVRRQRTLQCTHSAFTSLCAAVVADQENCQADRPIPQFLVQGQCWFSLLVMGSSCDDLQQEFARSSTSHVLSLCLLAPATQCSLLSST